MSVLGPAILLISLVALASVPGVTVGVAGPSSVPDRWDRAASFESKLSRHTDGWEIRRPFSVKRTRQAGSHGDYAAKIVTNGGSRGCSCPRMRYEHGFSYGPGDEVWLSGSWRIPKPGKVSSSRLMNLGHFEEQGNDDNWYLGLESVKRRTFQVSYARYYRSNIPVLPSRVEVLPSRRIPRDRWFRVDLHFILSPAYGLASTEWFIDGELVDSTTKANMRNADPLHFYNAGISYFWPGNGNTRVFFDAPRLTGEEELPNPRLSPAPSQP